MMANHDVNSSRRENPHKYILYKPTITQIMMFLATGLNINFTSIRTRIFLILKPILYVKVSKNFLLTVYCSCTSLQMDAFKLQNM